MTNAWRFSAGALLALLALLLPLPRHAASSEAEVGVVIMHGKGGRPDKFVDRLASALEAEGFQVANLEMPWSGRRQYDVKMTAGVEEISRALETLRGKGTRKVFVVGHSQGGFFALHYGGQRQVDGIIPIAPGGAVDGVVFVNALGQHVAKARQMVAESRGDEKAAFNDYEGSRGTNGITTTAAIYLDWFDPSGAHTSHVFKSVKEGTPVLYVAPRRDYPGLIKMKQENFASLPSHPQTRMYEPDSDHLNAPTAAAGEIIRWIRQIAAR